MSDTRSPRTATEGTWGVPLLVLAPPAVIRLFAEPTGAWLIACWALWILAAVLVAAGWVAVARHGSRGRAWGTCLLVHAVLAWQLALLLIRH
ncbi:hypothetical protein J7E99_24605 [Streptomyces sp. ISL-44]|uniref:hypothetical protein n=1 Tax=unclassified Streptomyces TaxID=2593676 RepID=UPI001BEC223E|nr:MULTISPECIES: hypothetical protein [unclassified Streptomyces]MBT2543791.1 hypothetical protein [Streptomyces sp. ISL-44]MCX5607400.1 hypothetical protein [Streptomyces sp. NBC_00047]UUU41506.1 hypothetical protein JIW86_23390 [Streptomyces sp. NBC_00162]